MENNTLNFAQKTNFIAGSPQFQGMEFYIKSVSLPGLSFSLVETSSQGMKHNLPSSTYSHGDLTFNVLIDEDFKVYDLFYNDMLKSKHSTSATYAPRFFDLYINVYNNKGNILFTENFHNCLIENIGDLSLDTTDNGTTQDMSVTIKYDWHDIVKAKSVPENKNVFDVYS